MALARLARHYLDRPGTTFLLAERQPDGTRSFRVLPGQPQATSHGIDLYERLCERTPT